MGGRPSKLFIVLAATSLVLTACVGKLHMGTTHAIDATPLLPGATLTETVRLEADGAFGEGLGRSELATPTFSSGWKMTDASEGGTRRIVAMRSFSGDEIYALPDEPEMLPILGRTAVRITDYVVARKIEVRIGASPPFSFGGETDQVTRGLTQMLLGGVTVDHTVRLPGILLGGNGSPAEGGGMIWHLDLTSTEGRVLTAESLYIDWARLLILGVIVAAGVVAVLVRRARARVAPTPRSTREETVS